MGTDNPFTNVLQKDPKGIDTVFSEYTVQYLSRRSKIRRVKYRFSAKVSRLPGASIRSAVIS